MKSNKQRKSEIKLRRWKLQEAQRVVAAPKPLPAGVLLADQARLALLNNDWVWGWQPGYYSDKAYRCCDCDADCVWKAADQKWWYEEAQGSLLSSAVRCNSCRVKHRAWRLSHCDADEMAALRALWRSRPDRAARERVDRALVSNNPAIRCLATQALAWWWMQYGDMAAFKQLEDIEFEKSWAPRIHRILDGEIELRPDLYRVHRTMQHAAIGAM